MSTLRGQRINLRCFLEGQEIPIVAAAVQMSINVPATCTIQVVPLDELHELQPRTMVHVFYFDNPLDDTIDLQDLRKYRLLFAGETMAISFNKTPTGRSAVIQCSDFTGNWDLCYQYMITYGAQGNYLTEESAVWAGASNMFNNIVDGHAAVLSRYLERTPKTPGLRNTKGLLGGIISLIEAMGGVRNHTQGVNDYFTISELKNRTMQQIVAEENDNTAQHLFDSKEFMEWLEGGASSLGELVTIRDMLRLLFGYIYYEIVPNMCAMYRPGSGQQVDPELAVLAKVNGELIRQYNIFKDDKDIEKIKARAVVTDEVLERIIKYPFITKKQKDNLTKAISYVRAVMEATKYSKNVASNISSTRDYMKKSMDVPRVLNSKALELDRLNAFIFRPECYFVAPPRCNVIFPEQITNFSFDRNTAYEITRLRLQSGMAFGIDKDKLFAEYAWAPALPQIKELAKKQGSNNTRILLPWEKFTGIIPKFAYVNEINYYANKKQKDLQKQLVGQSVSYRQKAANFNFFKHRFAARSIGLSCRFNPFVVLGFPALVIDKPFIVERGLLQAAAKSKGVTVEEVTTQGVVDKIREISSLLQSPTQYLGMVSTLTHSLSADSSSAVTNISMSHARTHKVTDDDFLKIFQYQKTKEAGISTVTTVLDFDELQRNGDRKLLQFLIDATPQSVKQTNQERLDNTPTNTKLAGRPKLKVDGLEIAAPTFKDESGIARSSETGDILGAIEEVEQNNGSIQVPATYGKLQPGKGVKGPKGGKVVEVQILNNVIATITEGKGKSKKEKYAWKTAVIYEEVEGKEILKPVPIEEALRPSWFSPLYSNLYIGNEIYMKFFGTGSVVDEIVYQSNSGELSIQGAGKEKKQILDRLAQSDTKLADVDALNQTQLSNIPDVETAVNILAFQYGELKRLGLDTHRFIYDYTYRPIATLEQVLGSSDLEYKVVGDKLEKVQGTSGFHSTSISFDRLLGLIDNPDIELSRLNDSNTSKISRTLDPRKERRAKVEAYRKKLETGSGFVIGVLG